MDAVADGSEDLDDYESDAPPAGSEGSAFGRRFGDLRRYLRLYAVLLAVTIIAAILIFVFVKPTYTAKAIIGPPSISPTDTMLADIGSTGVASLAKKALGSSLGGQNNDPYQEYLQLLPSTRLAEILINKDHFLQTIYYEEWDAGAHRWKTGFLHAMSSAVKRYLGRPVTNGPDVDTLMLDLQKNLDVVGLTAGTSSILMPGSATYQEVSFRFEDPHQAEIMLGEMLADTDRIIRDDQKRDVVGRVSYLAKELSNVTNSDERVSLISILTQQEQLLAMLEADRSYASTLVVPPHASLKPTSPPSLAELAILAVGFSTAMGVALVVFGTRVPFIRRLVWFFERKPKA